MNKLPKRSKEALEYSTDLCVGLISQVKLLELKKKMLLQLVRAAFPHRAAPPEAALIELSLEQNLLRAKEQYYQFCGGYNLGPYQFEARFAKKVTKRVVNSILEIQKMHHCRDNPYQDDWFKDLIIEVRGMKHKMPYFSDSYQSFDETDEDEKKVCRFVNNEKHEYPHIVCRALMRHRENSNMLSQHAFVIHDLRFNHSKDDSEPTVLQGILYSLSSANQEFFMIANAFGGRLQQQAKELARIQEHRYFTDAVERNEMKPKELVKLFCHPVECSPDSHDDEDKSPHYLRFEPDGSVWGCCAPDNIPHQTKKHILSSPQVYHRFDQVQTTQNQIEFMKRLGKTYPKCFRGFVNDEQCTYVTIIDEKTLLKRRIRR